MAEALYHAGVRHHLDGRLPEAVASYRRALLARPAYPQVLNNLGGALLRLDGSGPHEEAARALVGATELDPLFADAYLNLGLLHRTQGRLDAAVPIVVYVNLAVLYAMLAYMGYDTLVDLRNLAW